MLRQCLIVCLLLLSSFIATAHDPSTIAMPPETLPTSVAAEIPSVAENPVAPTATPAAHTQITPASSASPLANTTTQPTVAATAPLDDDISPSERYRRDLINLLALRTSAPLLLAAAVMAQPDDNDPDRPHALHSATLLVRAQAAGPSDALVWWITAFTCGNAIQLCPHPDALQKLTKIAANNSAIWVLEAQRTQKTGDRMAANAALTHAAEAHEYNDYSTELTRTLLQAISDLPVPPALLQKPPPGVASTAEGIQLTTAYNLANKLGPGAQPAATAALELCDPVLNAVQFNLRRKECVALASKLEWSSSLFAQRTGLALQLKLQAGNSANAQIANKQRNLAWQEQRSAEIMQSMLTDTDGTQQLQRLSLQSHTETGLIYALLRHAHVSLEAPLVALPEEAAVHDIPSKN